MAATSASPTLDAGLVGLLDQVREHVRSAESPFELALCFIIETALDGELPLDSDQWHGIGRLAVATDESRWPDRARHGAGSPALVAKELLVPIAKIAHDAPYVIGVLDEVESGLTVADLALLRRSHARIGEVLAELEQAAARAGEAMA
jgi:hypothetical protein